MIVADSDAKFICLVMEDGYARYVTGSVWAAKASAEAAVWTLPANHNGRRGHLRLRCFSEIQSLSNTEKAWCRASRNRSKHTRCICIKTVATGSIAFTGPVSLRASDKMFPAAEGLDAAGFKQAISEARSKDK